MEKGADYAKNEIQRIERILEKVLYMTFFHITLHRNLRHFKVVLSLENYFISLRVVEILGL